MALQMNQTDYDIKWLLAYSTSANVSCLLVAFMSDQVLDLLPLRHMVAHGFLKAGMFLVLAQAVIRAPYQRRTALDPHTRPMLTCMWSVGWLHSIVCYA